MSVEEKKNKDKDLEQMLMFDREHLWHPYTSMIDPLQTYFVNSAEGVYLELAEERKVIDGMSSWWSAVHGYNNPELNIAAKEQIDKMAHVMFGGLTHRAAVELGRKLIEITPEGLNRIFYCDSGSIAVEIAAKMALQYMQSKGEVSRVKLATIQGGYHGDSWHAMSVCDPVGGMHSMYQGRLPIQFFAARPEVAFDQEWRESDIEPMAQLLEKHHKEIAAVIVEPIVQGAGGMWFYHPNYLKQLRALCDHYDLLLIADEIATGFGRTGKMFASQWAGIVPDIICLGKAITGGYMSFAAVMTTDTVARTISENPPHTFMHGPTFMANPLAAAVANKSVEMLMRDGVLERIAQIEQGLKTGLLPLRESSVACGITDVRVLGAIGVVELKQPIDVEKAQRLSVEQGVWIRPFGRLFYVMPPYIITDKELEHLTGAMVRVISQL